MMIVTFEFFYSKKLRKTIINSDVSSGVDHDAGTIIMMKIIH